MKPTELRIGNYIYGINRRGEVHLPDNLPLKVLQIEVFNCDCLPLDKHPRQVEDWFQISNIDISPIPLTEDWLKKFGYKLKKTSAWDYYSNNESDLILSIGTLGSYNAELYNYTEDYVWQDLITIKYVHQLQNLYWSLCEKELTLK